MTKIISAIFENGVFKPLEKVAVPEHQKLTIILTDETEQTVVGECSLAGIIDIAEDCSDTDLSLHHDKYLYGDIAD